jgi:nitrogen fixation/metabolism regulation signal transduction histidine kinase
MEKKPGYTLGIRGKLILIFIVIKVIPLVILAIFATQQINSLGVTVKQDYSGMINETRELVTQIGDLSTENSIIALDVKSREAIERLTTDTAAAVASFLYQRDSDIAFASKLPVEARAYRDYLVSKKKKVTGHKKWVLN